MQRMFHTSRSFSSNSNSSFAESNIRLIVKFITLSCCRRFAKHQICRNTESYVIHQRVKSDPKNTPKPSILMKLAIKHCIKNNRLNLSLRAYPSKVFQMKQST